MSSNGLRSRKTRAVRASETTLTEYAESEFVLEHLQKPDRDAGIALPGANATLEPVAPGGIEPQARRFHSGHTTRAGAPAADSLRSLALARSSGRVARYIAKHP